MVNALLAVLTFEDSLILCGRDTRVCLPPSISISSVHRYGICGTEGRET